MVETTQLIALCDYYAKNIASPKCCFNALTILSVIIWFILYVSLRETIKRLQNRSTEDKIHNLQLDTEYNIIVITISLVRNLCKNFDTLHIATQTRIIDTHDFILLMVLLVEEPP